MMVCPFIFTENLIKLNFKIRLLQTKGTGVKILQRAGDKMAPWGTLQGMLVRPFIFTENYKEHFKIRLLQTKETGVKFLQRVGDKMAPWGTLLEIFVPLSIRLEFVIQQ
jgi:hypothetical protein